MILNRKSLVAVPCLIVFITAGYGVYHYLLFPQISQQEAAIKCQSFYSEVQNNIVKAQGYTIVNSNKSCIPKQDESGATDYYFTVNFDVAKLGNGSVDGLKANITKLGVEYPKQKYNLFIDNNTAADKSDNTICVSADSQIQEDGSFLYPLDSVHNVEYHEPGTLNYTYKSSCIKS